MFGEFVEREERGVNLARQARIALGQPRCLIVVAVASDAEIVAGENA
jgi:hypothetical protein